MRTLLAILFLLCGSLADAQAVRPIVPAKWDGKPYSYLREPVRWIPVWIGDGLESKKDATGTTMADRCREMFLGVECVCSLGFYEGEKPANCRWRFHYASHEHLIQYSQWKHPGNCAGSGYFAIHPNGIDIYIGNRLKPAMGGGLVSAINARRFCGHAWLCSMGWPQQGFPGEGPESPAMRSPYLSRPENWKSALLTKEGKAGFDLREIGWLQQWGQKYGGDGSCWVWRSE